LQYPIAGDRRIFFKQASPSSRTSLAGYGRRSFIPERDIDVTLRKHLAACGDASKRSARTSLPMPAGPELTPSR